MNQHIEMSGGMKKESGKIGFDGASYTKLAKSATIGTIVGVFSSVILMIVFAVIINAAFGDPDGVVSVFTGIAASAGAAIGGFQSSKINGSKGFIAGITTGIMISLVLLIIMIFGGGNKETGESSDVLFKLVIIILQIVFACAGGVFAVNSHKSKKSTRSHPVTFGRKK